MLTKGPALFSNESEGQPRRLPVSTRHVHFHDIIWNSQSLLSLSHVRMKSREGVRIVKVGVEVLHHNSPSYYNKNRQGSVTDIEYIHFCRLLIGSHDMILPLDMRYYSIVSAPEGDGRCGEEKSCVVA